MKRIGIIGTENSHATHFAKAINLPDPETGKRKYPGYQVTCLFGPDPEPAKKVMEVANVPTLLNSAEEMLGQVDAVMATNRWGSKHLEYALPFAEKGIPLFVDKPLTSDVEEAVRLVEAAKENGALLTGGSGCKYAWDVEILKSEAKKLREVDELLSASLNFAADTESPYDGFYFYAPHLTEMALTIFGTDVKAVQAFESKGGVVAIWRYEDFDVSLHYTRNSKISHATIYGKNQNVTRQINIDMIYGLEVEKFIGMLDTGVMPHDYSDFVTPVRMMDAILSSLSSGRLVTI